MRGAVERHQRGVVDEVRVHERPGVGWREPVRGREPREQGVGLGDGMGGDRHPLAAVEPPLDLGGRPRCYDPPESRDA